MYVCVCLCVFCVFVCDLTSLAAWTVPPRLPPPPHTQGNALVKAAFFDGPFLLSGGVSVLKDFLLAGDAQRSLLFLRFRCAEVAVSVCGVARLEPPPPAPGVVRAARAIALVPAPRAPRPPAFYSCLSARP